MVKSNDISGAQLLEIIFAQMKTETAVDVITDVFKSIVPATIKRFMPPENYQEFQDNLFELVYEILESGVVPDKATKHLLFDVMISSALSQEAIIGLTCLFDEGDYKGLEYSYI
jgi:hypothetical protein